MESLNVGQAGNDNVFEIATFYIRGLLCGMEIVKIQEINKLLDVTYVPNSPDYVLGILNLRGQIVTVIDLAMKLGGQPSVITKKSRNVIVNTKNESIGLLVDMIDDIVVADADNMEPQPANLKGVEGKYLKGVLKMEDTLIAILDLDEVLDISTVAK